MRISAPRIRVPFTPRIRKFVIPRMGTPLGLCAAVMVAASGLVVSGSGAPAASAQQFFMPGSSFGSTFGDISAAPELDPASEEYRDQLIDATNAARAEHGRAPLQADPALNQIATSWSQTQARANRMYHNPDLPHQLPAGATRWSENVLQNWRNATPQELVDQWMASPAHRVNLLRADHTTMGMGVAVAADNKLYATQVFARY